MNSVVYTRERCPLLFVYEIFALLFRKETTHRSFIKETRTNLAGKKSVFKSMKSVYSLWL